MNGTLITRRDFVKVAAVAGSALAFPAANAQAEAKEDLSANKIWPFDFQGVKLGPSRWQKQFQSARDFYFGVSNDDILHGFRKEAALPAPGQPLGGWAERNSSVVFGQWLSGMSRIAKATGDDAMRDKAILLASEWTKTVSPDGNCRMGHYPFEKLVCGLVDLKRYTGYEDAIPVLEKVTEYASKNLDRTRPRYAAAGGNAFRQAVGMVHGWGKLVPRVPNHRQRKV